MCPYSADKHGGTRGCLESCLGKKCTSALDLNTPKGWENPDLESKTLKYSSVFQNAGSVLTLQLLAGHQ